MAKTPSSRNTAGRTSRSKGAKSSKASKTTPTKAKARPRASAKPETAPEAVKSPLTKKELNEFRQMLLDKRRMLVGDMTGMHNEAFRGADQGDLSTMPVHMADVGTDNYEQEFTLGLLESERKLLRDIDEALGRLDAGTYGICLGTGKVIGQARLRAQPWAKYCIEYARLLEQGLVKRGNGGSARGFPPYGHELFGDDDTAGSADDDIADDEDEDEVDFAEDSPDEPADVEAVDDEDDEL